MQSSNRCTAKNVDVRREEMYQALDDFAQASSQAPVALFYFAGHATQVGTHNFMLPVGAKLDQRIRLCAAAEGWTRAGLNLVRSTRQTQDPREDFPLLGRWRNGMCLICVELAVNT